MILAAFSPAAWAQVVNPAYTELIDARVVGDPNQRSVLYQVTTEGTIPKKPDTFIQGKVLCFGYAWIGDPDLFDGIGDPNERPAVIATLGTVSTVINNSCQIGDPNSKSNWNTQTVTLAKPNGPVCIVGFSDPNERTSIRTNTLRTSLSTADAEIFPSTFELAASFELQVDTTNCPTGSTMGLKMVAISVQDPNE